jgi:hypothetical protein
VHVDLCMLNTGMCMQVTGYLNGDRTLRLQIAFIIIYTWILVLTPSKLDKNKLHGVTFGVAEISVSFNHGSGGEWWGGFVVCDTNTYGTKIIPMCIDSYVRKNNIEPQRFP